MKKFHAIAFKTSLFLVFLFVTYEALAQCAMCKAVAEESLGEGYGMAMGLNNGIIFLMFIPYALITILFLTFFRKQIFGFVKSFSDIH